MAELHHTWRYEGNNGRHWVHHSSRDQHTIDSIGVGLGEDILGPFPSRKLAIQVANALTNAHRAGYVAGQPGTGYTPVNTNTRHCGECEPCEECHYDIPGRYHGGMLNRHHASSCSLYDPDKD